MRPNLHSELRWPDHAFFEKSQFQGLLEFGYPHFDIDTPALNDSIDGGSVEDAHRIIEHNDRGKGASIFENWFS